MHSLKTWLDESKSSFNFAETQSILISSRYRIGALEQPGTQKTSLHIEDEAISNIAGISYLGVQFDHFLNCDQRLLSITEKVDSGLRIHGYATRNLSLVTVPAMYKTLFEPHFRYCSSVWEAVGTIALQKLHNLQNGATRIVTNSPYDELSSESQQRVDSVIAISIHSLQFTHGST